MQARNLPEEKLTSTQIDFEFLLSIIDIRDVFWPITAYKITLWATYLAAIAGLVLLQHYEYLFHKISIGIHKNILPLMVVLYAFEPLLMLIAMLFTRYPEQKAKPAAVEIIAPDIEAIEPQRIIIRESNRSMAIIIPCHNSEKKIAETLKACLKIVAPEQIFVIDNGNSASPPDQTPDIVRKLSERIHYHWHPKGNKSIAQFIGASLAKDYPICLPIDDDVQPPADFELALGSFAGKFAGRMFPIRAIHQDGKSSLVIRWQDLEYQQADHFKMFEDRFHGALFPHGAACAWKREAWMEILRQHNTRFIGEDAQTGLIGEQLGYRLHIDMRYYFNTIAPHTIIGTPFNLYQQRVRSWSIGIQTLNYRIFRNFFTEWTCPPSDLAALKITQFYILYNNFVDWTRLLVMALSASSPLYWAKFGAILGAQELVLLFWHYFKLRHRPDLQQDFLSVSTMFVYRLMQIGFTTLGLIRLLTTHLPNMKSVKTIGELEKAGEFNYLTTPAIDLQEISLPESDPDTIVKIVPIHSHRFFKSFDSQSHQNQPSKENHVEVNQTRRRNSI